MERREVKKHPPTHNYTHQPSFTTHPNQKIHQRIGIFCNMNIGPRPQTKYKRGLQSMNRAALIIKSNPISLTPNGSKQKGAAIHTFSIFLPTKEPWQDKRVALTKRGQTHCNPTIARKRFHSTLAFAQCKSRCSTVSSSSSQRKHLLARALPLLLI